MKVGHSVIAAGDCEVDDLVLIHGDPEALVLASGTGPGRDDLSICFVWTLTLQVSHWTRICGTKQKRI